MVKELFDSPVPMELKNIIYDLIPKDQTVVTIGNIVVVKQNDKWYINVQGEFQLMPLKITYVPEYVLRDIGNLIKVNDSSAELLVAIDKELSTSKLTKWYGMFSRLFA